MNKATLLYISFIHILSSILLATDNPAEKTWVLELLSVNKYVNRCTICTKEPTIQILKYNPGATTFKIMPKEHDCFLDCKETNSQISENTTHAYRYAIHFHYKPSDIGIHTLEKDSQVFEQLPKVLNGKKVMNLKWEYLRQEGIGTYDEQGDENCVDYKNDEPFSVSLCVYSASYKDFFNVITKKETHQKETYQKETYQKETHQKETPDEDLIVSSEKKPQYGLDIAFIIFICYFIYLVITIPSEEENYLSDIYKDNDDELYDWYK